MDVLIIEDDLLFATRLEAIISETAHLFVGHCNSAAEVPHWLTNNSCDVALIDIHLGKGLNGIDISKDFKELNIPVIFTKVSEQIKRHFYSDILKIQIGFVPIFQC